MLITNRPESRREWHDQHVVLETGSHKHEVQAKNLSSTGALVIAEVDAAGLATGAEVKLLAYDSKGLKKFSATGRVVRMRPHKRGGIEVGIEFNAIDL